MDLSFEDSEPVNWTELKAYEALVDSSLDYSRENEERLFALNRNDILIVGDLKFSFNASKEGDEVCLLRERKMGEMKKGQRGGKLYIDRDDETVKSFEVENMVFDGEGLLDESVFKKLKDEHGMMLLRNRFFKCCAFRTDIQQFYKDHFGDDYKNAVVYDLYGNKRKACDVKLIFTPSSLKFLKLADKVKRSTGKDEDAYVYEYWLNRLGRFGVVKNEKRTKEMDEYWPGKEGYYHPMTYQMLNSLPLRVDDICPWKEGEIGVPNGEYLLKDDLEYFRKIKFEDGAFVSYVSAVGIKMSGDLLRYLIGKNSDFLKTEWGKNTRDKRLENYRTDIKRGHVHIEGDYYVLCSMPMELLRWSAWKKSGMDEASCEREFIKLIKPELTLAREEVYIEGMDGGLEISMFRNPHSSPSGIGIAKTVQSDPLKKYFRFAPDGNSNIIVISPANWDIMETLSGADFDSDIVLVTTNRVINRVAREVKEESKKLFPVPHLELDFIDKGNPAFGDKSYLAELDCVLCNNQIGIAANLGQVALARFWEAYRNNRLLKPKMSPKVTLHYKI